MEQILKAMSTGALEESPRRGDRPALSGAAESRRAALISFEIVDRGSSDCMVKATFEWGEKWADISMDTPPMALNRK